TFGNLFTGLLGKPCRVCCGREPAVIFSFLISKPVLVTGLFKLDPFCSIICSVPVIFSLFISICKLLISLEKSSCLFKRVSSFSRSSFILSLLSVIACSCLFTIVAHIFGHPVSGKKESQTPAWPYMWN